MRPYFQAGALMATLLLIGAPIRAQTTSFSLTDIAAIQSVGDPQLSPDGRWVAYTLSRVDDENDTMVSEVRLRSLDGGETKTVAAGTSPRWSPDGQTIAYLSRQGNRRGIFLHDVADGSDRFLVTVHSTDHFLGHRASKNFEWSPNGRWIAYVGAEPPAADPPDNDVRVIDRILYKTRTGFSDNRLTHVWLVSVEGGEPRVLTPGSHDEHSISWSPDAQRIAFVSNRSDDPDDNHRNDLWTVDVETTEVTRITTTVGPEFTPEWSPDGKHIAFLATVRPWSTKDSPPENTHAYAVPADGGDPRPLTRSLDRRVSNITWPGDGRYIYFTARDMGRTWIYRVDVATQSVEPVTEGNVQVRSYSLDADGRRLVYTQSDMTHSAEVWISAAEGTEPRRLTNANGTLLERVELRDAESLWFESPDKTRVQGWLMKPAGFETNRTYPLILWVHGGPHGMYGYGFSPNFQLLAAHGYGVLFINPRGSTGYGQAFADGCVLNWGGGDYEDLMAGVDHVLESHPWVNADQIGVIGRSYGGFMTNWIITQTDRFQAAVPMASLSNLISFYGTSLYQLLIEVEFKGKPWDVDELLWQWSPLNHVENVTTPTLLIHGEADNDVPIAQAEEMFIALKKLGVDTVLVRYPGEGHGIRKPSHVEDMHRRILSWFDRYVKGLAPGSTTP